MRSGERYPEVRTLSNGTGQGMPGNAGEKEISHNYTPLTGSRSVAGESVMKTFIDECQNHEIPVIEEELNELDIYLEFLSSHVTTGEGYSVPCMLLWSEWAKFYISQMQQYPEFILEKEFRYLILNQFKLPSGDIDSGVIYPGLQYVADKKRVYDNSIRPSPSLEVSISTCS
jgi:hypothetical protein